MLRMYMPGDWSEEALRELEAGLAEDVELFAGDSRADDYEMLVCRRPDRKMLETPSLRWCVVPRADLPASTRELLADFPLLAVHSLHHNAPAAAELTVGLLPAAAKHIVPADRKMREGNWTIRYSPENAMLIGGSIILVVGMGKIGQRVARTCRAMGAEVVGIALQGEEGEVREGVPVLPSEAQDAQLPGIDVWFSYTRSEESRRDTRSSRFPFGELDNVEMSPHGGGAMNVSELELLRARAPARPMDAAAAGGPVPHSVDPALGY